MEERNKLKKLEEQAQNRAGINQSMTQEKTPKKMDLRPTVPPQALSVASHKVAIPSTVKNAKVPESMYNQSDSVQQLAREMDKLNTSPGKRSLRQQKQQQEQSVRSS